MLRILPTSCYNTPAIETWLEDQAKKGIHLDYLWGPYAAVMKKGEPRNETYRFEASDGKPSPEGERLDAYHAAGWEHAATDSDDQLWLFRATRPDPLPIHTDPETQGIAFQRLQKKLRLYLAAWLAAAVLYVVMFVLGVKSRGLDYWDIPVFFSRMWIPIFWSGFCLGDVLSLRKLLIPLKAGIPLVHHAPCHQYRRWWFWLWVIYGALCVLFPFFLSLLVALGLLFFA